MKIPFSSDNKYYKCLICGQENVASKHFWSEHKWSEKDYCITYYPRKSLLTDKLIEFKSREFYFGNSFNGKVEFKTWIKANPDLALSFCLEQLRNRKDAGKIKYALSQVEIKTLCLPDIGWFEKICNYNTENKRIDIKTRFCYDNIDFRNYDKHKELDIFFDTREQKPLIFDKTKNQEAVTLKYGDYTCPSSEWKDIFIERKGLSDFISTLSSGYDRFCREIERADKNKAYLVVGVEAKLSDALSFNFLPYISKKIKASPDFVFQKLRLIMQAYDNIQFVFCDGREKLKHLIQQVYSLPENPRFFDLQYLVDYKLI